MAKKNKTKPVNVPELTVTSALKIRELQIKELSLRSKITEDQRAMQQLQQVYMDVKQDLSELFGKYAIEDYSLNADSLKYTKNITEGSDA